MGGKWPYSSCFVERCFQDLFSIAHSIFVQFLSSLFFIGLVCVHVVHLYSNTDTTAAWKKLCFILSVRSDLLLIINLSIAVCAFVRHILVSLSIDEMLLPRYVNLSTNFGEPPFRVEMSPWLKDIYPILAAFT